MSARWLRTSFATVLLLASVGCTTRPPAVAPPPPAPPTTYVYAVDPQDPEDAATNPKKACTQPVRSSG